MQMFGRQLGWIVAAILLMIGATGNATETGAVSGRVIDADGKGMQGIEVGVYTASALL